MATSNVDVANLALRILGEPPITSFTGTQKAQVLCAQELPFSRDEVLTLHPWSIALKRATLNEYAGLENFTDFKYIYVVPPDALRIMAVRPGQNSSVITAVSGYMDNYNTTDSSAYIIEGGAIYTNAEDAYAQYISRITNPSVLPLYLVEAIAANLAKRIAYGLVQNVQVTQFASQNYFNQIQLAMQMDSRKQSATMTPGTQWAEVY
jgi:hypothetical protein